MPCQIFAFEDRRAAKAFDALPDFCF